MNRNRLRVCSAQTPRAVISTPGHKPSPVLDQARDEERRAGLRATRPIGIISMLALCLSWIGFFPPERMRHHLSPRLPVPAPVPAPPPHSPAEQARREACRSWTRAQEVASEQLEALEEWDPTAYTGHGRERGLRQLMAGDPTGDLRRAQAAAIRAATLARTRGDAVEAAKLRALIACGLGHHDAELTQARLLMQLAPRDPTSLEVLQRAAECNGQTGLARRAESEASRLLGYPRRPSPAVGG